MSILRLETLRPLSFNALLQHFVLLTHAVPASRVRVHLPPELELETFVDQGQEMCHVSVGCFRNMGFRWSPFQYPRLNFPQITYRTYVRYRERVAVYYFKTFVGSRLASFAQRWFWSDAHYARIRIGRTFEQAGNSIYDVRCESRHGSTRITLAAGEADDSELAQQLSYRLHGFHRLRGGMLGDQFVSHRRLEPQRGRLLDARLELWERMGILEPSEILTPASVLVQPALNFRIFPSFPARFLLRQHPVVELEVEERHRRGGKKSAA